MKFDTRTTSLSLLGVVALSGVAFADGPAWQRYRDAASGISVSHPPGWTVERHSYTLLVRSADKSSVALIQAFQHTDGETASNYLQHFAGANTSLFPQDKLADVQPQISTAGDEAVASLHYRSASGASGLARVLCLVTPHSGYVFAIAAPSNQIASIAPTLVKVLNSFAFETGGASGSSGIPSPSNLHYTRWTDPLQNAFSVEIPAGWKVTGGTYQMGLTDYRKSILLSSPDGRISILCGDPIIPGFREPGALSAQLHQQEWSKISMSPGRDGVLLHYLPAQEVNQDYAVKRLSNTLDNVSITSHEDVPELASRVSQMAQANVDSVQPGAMYFSATADRASFTGTFKESGNAAAGFLQTWTRLATGRGQYSGVPRTWEAFVSLCIYPADMGQQGHDLCSAILQRFQDSTQLNAQWVNETNQYAMKLSLEQSQAVNRMNNENAQRFLENTVKSGEAFRAQLAASGNSFRAHQEENLNQRTANTERWSDYLLDQQKVVNPETGEINKVSSANYHYQNGDTVINSSVPLTFPDVNMNPVLLNLAPYTPHP